MPYRFNADLPSNVRNVLPSHAQDIYREAFNHAFERYGEDSARRIAWAAVKRRYEKRNGLWVESDSRAR
jgi:cation transport regulator